ncbi:hypothetical protein D3C81_1753610 [compost metagenome]
MHKLQHNFSVGAVHRVCHATPAVDLRLRVDTRRAAVTLAMHARLRTFCDDQPGTGAL